MKNGNVVLPSVSFLLIDRGNVQPQCVSAEMESTGHF